MAVTARIRSVVPPRQVVIAWLVSHIVATGALVLTPDTTDSGLRSLAFYRGLYRARLTFMDGGWYRSIVEHGYPRGALPDRANEWPFFPLYPWLSSQLKSLGVATRLSLIVVAWVAALVALWGVWKLVESRFGQRTAVWSVWFAAFAPGAIGLTMAYSDGLFVVGVVWALVLADRVLETKRVDHFDRRFLAIGLVASIATMSRPNGFLVVAALVTVAWSSSDRLRAALALVAPSAMFLTAWLAYSRHMTGDMLAFVSSKGSWLEVNLFEFVAHPFDRLAVIFHITVFIVTVVLAWPALRRLPRHWLVISAVLVLPSMLLGVEGLARYTFMAIPLTIAMAVRLADGSAILRNGTLVVSTAALVYLCANVVRYTWVP